MRTKAYRVVGLGQEANLWLTLPLGAKVLDETPSVSHFLTKYVEPVSSLHSGQLAELGLSFESEQSSRRFALLRVQQRVLVPLSRLGICLVICFVVRHSVHIVLFETASARPRDALRGCQGFRPCRGAVEARIEVGVFAQT